MGQVAASSFIREMRSKDGKPFSPKRWQLVVKVAQDNPSFVEDKRAENERFEFLGRGKNRRQNPGYIPDTRTAGERRSTIWVQKTRTYQGTKSSATKALASFAEEVAAKAGESEAAKADVISYISAYIDRRERESVDGMRSLEASTALDYRKSCKRLESGFGGIAVGEVTPRLIREWESKQLGKGVSVYQVRKCHRLLHLALEHAYMAEAIGENPCARVKPPATGERKEPNSLTREGMQFVTAQLEAMQPTPVVVASYIALHAGLRCAECCALTWSDVDFEAGTLSVRGSIGVAKGGSYAKGTKTGKTRVVDFDTEHMADMLKARRALMRSERDGIATDFGALYVCGSADGRYANPTSISREWSALSKSWGLVGTSGERINFHALRHSYVTAQLSTGSSVRDVADNAGHASTQMTVDTYASALRKGKKEVARKSGAYMRPERPDNAGAEVLAFDRTGTEG